MSKPVNPLVIGGFAIGALLLLVAGLLVFGGSQLFDTDKIHVVVFFDSSLNGLEIGAPVKMQGVKIGMVSDIKLEFDDKTTKIFKPVVLEINRKSFAEMDGEIFEISNRPDRLRANVEKLVSNGLRAQLEMQSLLTGLLYVNFSMYPDRPPKFTGINYRGLIELPSVAATTDEIRVTAEEMSNKLRKLPIDKIAQDLIDTLQDIRNLLGSQEMKQSNAALSRTLQEIEHAMVTLNLNLEPLLKSTGKTVADADGLVRDSRAMVNDVHHEVKPVLASAEKALGNADKAMVAATTALETATATLQKAQSALVTVEGAVGSDSTLNQTLIAMRDAAQSLKNLTDYLERHPEAVISGKGH